MLVPGYDFLNRGLLLGFDYPTKAFLKRVKGTKVFDLVRMEWSIGK